MPSWATFQCGPKRAKANHTVPYHNERLNAKAVPCTIRMQCVTHKSRVQSAPKRVPWWSALVRFPQERLNASKANHPGMILLGTAQYSSQTRTMLHWYATCRTQGLSAKGTERVPRWSTLVHFAQERLNFAHKVNHLGMVRLGTVQHGIYSLLQKVLERGQRSVLTYIHHPKFILQKHLKLRTNINQFVSWESKGHLNNAIQWCSIKNQKGSVAIDFAQLLRPSGSQLTSCLLQPPRWFVFTTFVNFFIFPFKCVTHIPIITLLLKYFHFSPMLLLLYFHSDMLTKIHNLHLQNINLQI